MSTPLSTCRVLGLTIVQDLPQSLIGNDTLSKVGSKIFHTVQC
jgi:hypothetical protein